MGGCYSANSAEAFKNSKLPRDRPFRKSGSKKNGKVEKESYAYGEKIASEDDQLISATELDGEEKKEVVPSDSGIESLAPNSVKDESELTPSHTEPVIIENKSCENDWYNTPTDNDIENPVCETEKNNPEYVQNYCSCGPRQVGNTSRHSNKCPTHMSSPKSNRNSDITGLKSSFKDFMRKTEKKVRLSWKSSDSLDINKQLSNHLDRAKSEQSEIFQDDISFCAPLAQFDSVGGNLDRPNSRNRMSNVSTASEIEAVARDICNCEFYANNLASELDVLVPERDETCPLQSPDNLTIKPNSSNKNSDTESVYDNEFRTDQKDMTNNDSKETKESEPYTALPKRLNESHIVKQISLASLSSIRPSLSSLGDVTMTTYEGRDMVMIDVETYTQILEELQLLKTKLSQLTTIIQEDPVLDQAFQMMDACQLNFEDSILDNEESETE